jgi:hypothetical protein
VANSHVTCPFPPPLPGFVHFGNKKKVSSDSELWIMKSPGEEASNAIWGMKVCTRTSVLCILCGLKQTFPWSIRPPRSLSKHRSESRITGIIFDVFRAVTMKNGVFWDVTPCGSCKNRRSGGTSRLLQHCVKNRRTMNNASCN